MQKVHGPPVQAQHGHLDPPLLGALVVSLSLLAIVCAIFYFGAP